MHDCCHLHDVGLRSEFPTDSLASRGPGDAQSPGQEKAGLLCSALLSSRVPTLQVVVMGQRRYRHITIHTCSGEKMGALTRETPLLKRGFK